MSTPLFQLKKIILNLDILSNIIFKEEEIQKHTHCPRLGLHSMEFENRRSNWFECEKIPLTGGAEAYTVIFE